MDNKKYNLFCFVINASKESPNPREELEHFQGTISKEYSTTFYVSNIHDKDTEDNGQPKTIHLHAYIEYPEKEKYTTKQQLIKMANVLHINQNQISVDGTYNNHLYIQYLASHKNDVDKYHYDHTLAITNDLLLYEERYNTEYKTPEDKEKEMLNDLLKSPTLIEFATKHGLEKANKFRNLYKDFQQEQKLDIKQLNGIIENYEKFVNRLELAIQNHKTYDNFIDVDIIINLIKTIFWCF